jgi:hypothetical protein
MALIADVDNLDLVVEPHESMAEDREAFRRAVEERRNRPAPSPPHAAGNGESDSE